MEGVVQVFWKKVELFPVSGQERRTGHTEGVLNTEKSQSQLDLSPVDRLSALVCLSAGPLLAGRTLVTHHRLPICHSLIDTPRNSPCDPPGRLHVLKGENQSHFPVTLRASFLKVLTLSLPGSVETWPACLQG